jgi:lysine 2,3-aminomutase
MRFRPQQSSLQEQHEEKALGYLDDDKAATLVDALRGGGSPEKTLRTLQRKWQAALLGTDRSVMNLPGIGKA